MNYRGTKLGSTVKSFCDADVTNVSKIQLMQVGTFFIPVFNGLLATIEIICMQYQNPPPLARYIIRG